MKGAGDAAVVPRRPGVIVGADPAPSTIGDCPELPWSTRRHAGGANGAMLRAGLWVEAAETRAASRNMSTRGTPLLLAAVARVELDVLLLPSPLIPGRDGRAGEGCGTSSGCPPFIRSR